MRSVHLLYLATAALAALWLAGCPAEPAQRCGDYVATGEEDCDGYDLRGATCGDVVAISVGTLLCNDDCTYNTTGCTSDTGGCGNAIVEWGEQCDCGTDPDHLPAGCTDVNNGPLANCSTNCEERLFCGDGVRALGEFCDCGLLYTLKPSSCTALNGEPGGECTLTCEWTQPTCDATAGQVCDPINDRCCPDPWGVDTVCFSSTNRPEPHCTRPCTETQDCPLSSECDLTQGVCQLSLCGPGQPFADLHDYCAVPGGGAGWCVPLQDRTQPDATPLGVCMENGVLAPGDDCALRPGWLQIDREEPSCDEGLCVDRGDDPWVGGCVQFCDWEVAYDSRFYGAPGEVLPCSPHQACMSYAHLDPITGVRVSDLARCGNRLACSLINGHLMSDPTERCDTWVADNYCVLRPLEDGGYADGTLIGQCEVTDPPNRSVWDTCDPAADRCPESTLCRDVDFFSAVPQGPSRCLPLCDAAHHLTEADCTALGAGDASALCRSLSERYAPTDVSPTRLGLCALP